MSRRKPDEVPYVELTRSMEREIECIGRNSIPYYGVGDEIGEHEGASIKQLKYRGKEYTAYYYRGVSRVILKRGETLILTSEEDIARKQARYLQDKEETRLLREQLKVDNSKPF